MTSTVTSLPLDTTTTLAPTMSMSTMAEDSLTGGPSTIAPEATTASIPSTMAPSTQLSELITSAGTTINDAATTATPIVSSGSPITPSILIDPITNGATTSPTPIETSTIAAAATTTTTMPSSASTITLEATTATSVTPPDVTNTVPNLVMSSEAPATTMAPTSAPASGGPLLSDLLLQSTTTATPTTTFSPAPTTTMSPEPVTFQSINTPSSVSSNSSSSFAVESFNGTSASTSLPSTSTIAEILTSELSTSMSITPTTPATTAVPEFTVDPSIASNVTNFANKMANNITSAITTTISPDNYETTTAAVANDTGSAMPSSTIEQRGLSGCEISAIVATLLGVALCILLFALAISIYFRRIRGGTRFNHHISKHSLYNNNPNQFNSQQQPSSHGLNGSSSANKLSMSTVSSLAPASVRSGSHMSLPSHEAKQSKTGPKLQKQPQQQVTEASRL